MTKKTTFNEEAAANYHNATENSYPQTSQRLSEEGLRGDYISQFETEYGPLTDEIRKALLDSKQINASGINLRVGKNDILLYGSVLSESERKTAEEIVTERAQGRLVKNEITLQH